MNHANPFEERLGEWLEDAPVKAPDAVLETVLAAFPQIRQRRPWLVIGGRPVRVIAEHVIPDRLAPWLRIAAVAAAIVVLAATGIRFLVPVEGPGGRSGVELTPYTSARYHYSISYPAAWTVREATRSLSTYETPWESSDAIDLFQGIDGEVIVAGVTVPPGTTVADWATSTTTLVCGPPTTVEPTDVDGELGSIYTYDLCFSLFHQWAVVVHGESAFHIVWLNTPGNEARDRVLFEDILASFRFTN